MVPAPEWESLLADTDRQTIAAAGYGRSRGLGSKPALLLVDAQTTYFGSRHITAPTGVAIGKNAWDAADRLASVLAAFRRAGYPVLYTVNLPLAEGNDLFASKRRQATPTTYASSHAELIVGPLAPEAGEPVLAKAMASAFFGTPLATHLQLRCVDSLIIGGVSTSGCVRATVVDAVSHGYHALVIRDGVADRIDASHRISLLDLWMKYADLCTADELLTKLDGAVAGERADHG